MPALTEQERGITKLLKVILEKLYVYPESYIGRYRYVDPESCIYGKVDGD